MEKIKTPHVPLYLRGQMFTKKEFMYRYCSMVLHENSCTLDDAIKSFEGYFEFLLIEKIISKNNFFLELYRYEKFDKIIY